ncbi:vWA domain-containing protein [Methylobrevis pamukkalensis]|nr:vWA domain-containing protein [Methylobrevis pamukkalensis]
MTRLMPLARLLALLAVVFALPVTRPALAEERQALPIPGKTSLYQRVVTKPGARLLSGAETGAEVIDAELPAFSIYYVFGEAGERIEVGVNSRGTPLGFIDKAFTVAWKQSIVAAFNNRIEAERARVLFFDAVPSLEAAIGGDGYVERLADLRAAAESGSAPAGVVAIEPEAYVDIDRNFYLLPILSHQSAWLADGQPGTILEVASVNAEPPPPEAPTDDFRAGFVFVVDTTISMQDYIDATAAALARVSDTLSSSAVGDSIRFGLVGFRQPVEGRPNLEYGVKTFLPLAEDSGVDRLVEELRGMKAARVPTPTFDEDAIGGLYEAVARMDWEPFGARYVVLLTDAARAAPRRDGPTATAATSTSPISRRLPPARMCG